MRIELSRSAENPSPPDGASAPGFPPPRNAWKAEVTLHGDTVRKDFSRCGPVARLVGRHLLDREQRALIRAAGIPGVPRFVARPETNVLVMTRVEGTPLHFLRAGDLDESFLENLIALFAALHERGVAHGDAHLRNILAHGATPALVDFATAWTTRTPGQAGRVFEWFCQLDRRQLYKAEYHLFRRGSPPEMFLLYRLFKS